MNDTTTSDVKIKELKEKIDELRIAREQLRDVSNRLVGVLDCAEYDAELIEMVCKKANIVLEATKDCKGIINDKNSFKNLTLKLTSAQLSKLDAEEGRKPFNQDDINSYSPDAMARFVALYEKQIADEANKAKEAARNSEILRRFRSLTFNDPEDKYKEGKKILDLVQKQTSEKSPCIREYDLVYQCAMEPSYEKVMDAVYDNLTALEKAFYPYGFSEIERALYRHLIVVKTEDSSSPTEVSVTPIEELGHECGQLHSNIVRSPRPLSALLKEIASPIEFIVIAMALDYPEFSVELVWKCTGSLSQKGKKETENAVEHLYNRGYLLKHSLSVPKKENSWVDTYAATLSGRDVFMQEKCLSEIKKRLPRVHVSKQAGESTYDPSKLTAAGFLRISICLRVIGRCEEVTGGSFPNFFTGKSGFPFITCYDQKNTPRERIVIVPAIVSKTEDGVVSGFLSDISEILEHGEAEQTKIILLSIDVQGKIAAAQWGKILLPNISGKPVELFCGTQAFDVFSFLNTEGELAENEITAEELLYQYIGATKPKNVEDANLEEGEPVDQLQNAETPAFEESEADGRETEKEIAAEVVEVHEEPNQETAQNEGDGEVKDDLKSSEDGPASGTNADEGFSCAAIREKFDADADIKTAIKWMAKGKVAEGLVLLRSKEGVKEHKDNPYLLFAAAAGDPMLQRDIADNKTGVSIADIDGLFDGEATDDAARCLQNCYWLRRLILDNADIPWKILNHESLFFTKNAVEESAGSLLYKNWDYLRKYNRRINQADISLAGDDPHEELQRYAKGLAERVQNIAGGGGNRIRSTRDGLLGGKSRIGSAVLRIAEGDRSTTLVNDCREIVEDYLDKGSISEKKVIERVDEEWNRHRADDINKKSRDIAPDVENTLSNRVMEALELLQKWGSLSREVRQNSNVVPVVKECVRLVGESRNRLNGRKKTSDTLTEAAYQCMRFCMEELENWYSGKADEVEKAYARFYERIANSDYVITIGNGTSEAPYLPLFPKAETEWESVWQENKTVHHITDMTSCIKAHCANRSEDSPKGMTRDEFLGKIEVYDAQGWFAVNNAADNADNKDEKAAVRAKPVSDAEEMEEYYWEKLNLPGCSANSKRLYEKLLRQISDDCIEPLVRDKKPKDFGATKPVDTTFTDFWDKCDNYAASIMSDRYEGLLRTAEDYIKRRRLKTFNAERKLQRIAESWPKTDPRDNNYETYCDLIEKLNSRYKCKGCIKSPVTEIVHGINVQRLTISISVVPEDSGDYSSRPPIPEFGTKMRSVDVACILRGSSVVGAESIGNTVASLCGSITKSNTPLIVLLNRALKRDEWMRLSSKLKTLTDRQRVLVIDWGIVLHAIQTENDTDTWDRIMKCAIPLHYFNPFLKASAPVPPELFAGRKKTVSDFNNPEAAAHFLYGGRQLGKTAIFDYVSETGSGVYIYASTLNFDKETVLKEINEKFLEKFDDYPKADNWETLCDNLKRAAKELKKANKKLTLLIDEADTFLDELCENFKDNGCSLDNDIIQRLHRIETDPAVKGYFHFAFAGKHNVYRFYHWCKTYNIDWVAKTRTIQVKPFTFNEAEELVDKLKSFNIRFEANMEYMAKQEVFSVANYYPGLIHLFCHKAVELVNERWTRRSAADASGIKDIGILTKEDINKIIGSGDFLAAQKGLFDITINLEVDHEDTYRCIVYALAVSSLEHKKQAFSAKEIKDICEDFSKLEKESVPDYLDELCELSILNKVDRGEQPPLYEFKRAKYRDYLRPNNSKDDDEIYNKFLELAIEH